ncbi:MAG: TolC family protein, partial [Pseudomonadota bacterium]
LKALGQLYERSGNWFQSLDMLQKEVDALGTDPKALISLLRIGRINDPATSPSLTAGEDRLLSTEGDVEIGIRTRVRTGAEITLAQRFGAIDTNQTDFIPGEQASARTSLTIVQPLLRGSGLDVNNAPTELAELDTKIAQYELVRQLENHLLEVERAYWALYTARANLFLSRHLAGHGRRLVQQAAARQEVDGDPTLGIRARAAASRWEAGAVRAASAVDNAQFRLGALTNTPELTQAGAELVTVSPPAAVTPRVDRLAILNQMMERRPELQQAFLQYEAAALREGIAANEQLPELDLILEGTLAGNADDRDFSGAFGDNEPGGLVGLQFSVPLGADERDARYERRRLETVQQRHQTRAALSTVLLEVEVSASELAIAAKDLEFRRRARLDAQRELEALRVQWEDGSGFQAPSSTLDDLLGAHERVSQEEQAVARARATLAVAAANFSRARGVLLDRWNVEVAPTTGVRDETIYRANALLDQ